MIAQPTKYFETDGIRGKLGVGPITTNFAKRLGYTVGKTLTDEISNKKNVLLGRDTRISGTALESSLALGLTEAGMAVKMLGIVSTPALAHFTKESDAVAGIMISASHNLFEDNGYKIFSGDGQKISREFEEFIELGLTHLEDDWLVPSRQFNLTYFEDWEEQYAKYCLEKIDSSMSLRRLKIVVDCANGATYKVASNILRRFGPQLFSIGGSPNGYNINSAVGSTNPTTLQKAVMENRSDIGIAFDGDGDRVIMVDEQGNVADGDDLLFVLAKYHLGKGRLVGGVVGTQMSNLGLEQSLVDLGLKFDRASVGDRFVMEKLKERDWILGGEPSGHIICRDFSVGGDGLMTSLLVLESMVVEGASLCDLRKGLVKFPQKLFNVPVRDKFSIMDSPHLLEVILKAENSIGRSGRILVRPSGTEPLIRVMVEGSCQDEIESEALVVANAIKRMDG